MIYGLRALMKCARNQPDEMQRYGLELNRVPFRHNRVGS